MWKKQSKYRSRKVEIDGITFDSIKEGERYKQLRLLRHARVIEDLELQPKFEMLVEGKKVCSYIADFSYTEDGRRIVEDTKGFKTAVYRLKKKLFEALYPHLEHRET